MDEMRLYRLSIVGMVLGMVALYFIAVNLQTKHIDIKGVTQSFVGSSVNVTGEIKNFKASKGNLLFDLDDGTGKLAVVVWSDSVEDLQLSGFDISKLHGGAKVNIIGSVQLYKGEVKISPIRSQIKVIS